MSTFDGEFAKLEVDRPNLNPKNFTDFARFHQTIGRQFRGVLFGETPKNR